MNKINIQKRIPMVLIGMLIAGILIISSAFPASAVSITYTTDADFDDGTLVGLEHNTTDNQLQLSKISTAFPFIWVPNTDEGTISKVDIRTGYELGRYRVTPPGLSGNGSPSRTTVDLEGNVWVGNRQAGTVVKVGLYEAGQCTDRNGNGTIETSLDNNGDYNITGSELLPWGEDECVLYEVVLIPPGEGTYIPGTYTGPYDEGYWGVAPRGLAIDKDNNLWAGTWITSKYYYINGTNGQINRTIDVSSWNHNAYGAVIDRNGVLWSSGGSSNNILRLDPSTDPPTISKIDTGTTVYGLGLDQLDHLFVSEWCNDTFVRINILTDTIEWTKPTTQVCTRGVVVTSDNNVWLANSNSDTVTRYDNDGNLLVTISGFNQPSGVAVDSAGKVWVSDIGSEYIYRINTSTNTVDMSKQLIGSGGHYTYSDMTGFVSRTITTTMGTWNVIYNSSTIGTEWSRVSWNSSIPVGASIQVKVRAAETEDDLDGALYEDVINGVNFNINGQFIQVETRLTSNLEKESPILYDLIVESMDTYNISGTKFNDSNGDGDRDDWEAGVPGIGIRLTREDGSFAGYTITDNNGNYSFMNLEFLDNYWVEEVLSNLSSQTFPSGQRPHSIIYDPSDATLLNLDFGNQLVPGGVIRGTKFNDSNGNGAQEVGESGISGVTICLWPSQRCTTTNLDGNYTFPNVAPGTQTVYEHVPSGFTATTAAMVDVTVNSEEVTIVNFGNRVLVPPPPDVTVPDATVEDGVPTVLTVNPVVIQKNLSNIANHTDIVAVVLTLTWSDGTTRTQSMTEIGTTNVWEATFGQPFLSGTAQMNFSVDVDPAGPSPNDAIQIGDIIFRDPSGQIQDACTGAPISGVTATLLIEFPPTTGNFIESPTGLVLPNQIPDVNPLITGADGRYSWLTVPGTFKVRAEKAGYITAESPPVSIPPPVFDLNITLTPVKEVAIKYYLLVGAVILLIIAGAYLYLRKQQS